MENTSAKIRERLKASADFSIKNLLITLLLAVFAFLVMGYHPGLEDDSFYLAAVKRDLNPALFPHDSEFFRVQFQATIFDKLIALSVRATHLPLAWVVLLWQLLAIFFILHGCWRIARRCFVRPEAQWAATTLIAALLTLPVSGVAINLADQYLHPRNLATALIVAAIVAVIDEQIWITAILLVIAFAIHAIMASFGISFCVFLYVFLHRSKPARSEKLSAAIALLFPLSWIFEPASDAWRNAAATRGFYFLGRWEWYEWLGVFAPILLVYVFLRFVRTRKDTAAGTMIPFTSALIWYGIFQTVVGLVIMLPPSLERLRPFEPMRYLHLLYLLFFLLVGAVIGQYLLDRRVYRWLLLFVPLCGGMLYAQRQLYPASPHLELPWVHPTNPWLQAFAWIRQSTPVDALFALDPHYEALPAEDYHGFRALAERSALADYEKDGGMAARVPSLAPRWLKEVTALKDWHTFQPLDLQRLKNDFGVSWIVLSREDREFLVQAPEGMACPYQNQAVRVCHLY